MGQVQTQYELWRSYNVIRMMVLHIIIAGCPDQICCEGLPAEYKTPLYYQLLMKYKLITLPASLLDVDTRPHSLFSVSSISISVRQLPVIIL